MRKFIDFIFSMEFMVILLLGFGLACGVATIIEARSGTQMANLYIYKSWWFYVIMALLTINLIYNLFRLKMFKLKKFPSFIFHLSFVMIFLGACVTHFWGKEGAIRIREGSRTNLVATNDVYIQLISKHKDGSRITSDLKRYIKNDEENSFSLKLDTGEGEAVLNYKKLILNAEVAWVDAKDGIPVVELLFWDDKNKNLIPLENEALIPIADLDLAFNTTPKQKNYIKIHSKDGKFYINTNQNISYKDMMSLESGVLPLNKDALLETDKLYNLDGVNFSPSLMMASAKLGVKELPKNIKGDNAIIAELNYNGVSEEIFALFGNFPMSFEVGGKEFGFSWSPKMVELPFFIHLDDFILDRYPGSNSPSGYKSEVTIIDNGSEKSYEIYMNNVLDYAGYRFFQSSYDSDEKGTILSVNKDPGKIPTYAGYFLLMAGMFLNFFNKNSRFLKLARMIDDSSSRKE